MMELKVDLRHPKVTKKGRYCVLGGTKVKVSNVLFITTNQFSTQIRWISNTVPNHSGILKMTWCSTGQFTWGPPLPPRKNNNKLFPVSKPSNFEKIFNSKNSVTDSSRLNLAHISVTKELGMEALSFLFIVILTHLAIMANILGH